MMEEDEAIARLKRGELIGLEMLVHRYQAQAVQAAYLIVRDRALAEDVAQTAFLRAAEKIDQYDSARPFAPWFLRSVVNAALKAAARQKRLVPLEDEPDPESAFLAAALADPGPFPEDLAETEETTRLVWAALDQLTPHQRAAVVLRHFLEMSEAEMTLALGRPRTTVKWWLHAARQRLRVLLAPYASPSARLAGEDDRPQE